MDFLNNIQPWVWLVIGLALLSLEALGTAGFILGSALSAIVVSVILWIFPELSWPAQLLFFASGSFLLTLAYWKFFFRVNEQTDQPKLNNRLALLVGQHITIAEDIPTGIGRIQIGDTFWKIKVETPLSSGQVVKVVSYEGLMLIVQPLTTP